MKIIEFVEYMKKSVNRSMKEDQILSMVKKKLEAKEYISIKEKKALIDNIIHSCILYDNGIYKFDGIDKYVHFTMYTIEACTNLELSADIEEDFDTLSREKLLPIVIGAIQKEYDDINILFQMQCDSFLESNSVEASIGELANGVMDFLNRIESKLNVGLDQIANLKLDEKIDFSKLLSMINKN